jgi:hypothetical protein
MTDALIIQDNFAHALPARGPHAARVFKNKSLGKSEGAGNAGRSLRPQPRVRKIKSTPSKSTTVTPVSPGIPRAMVLTGSFVVSSVNRAFLPPSPRNAKHCRELIPASGYQDAKTSPSAIHALVRRARRVHRIPHPTFVTIAKRPSSRARNARKTAFDLPDATRQTPAALWHDGQITLAAQNPVK